jgi:hypothetical protein
VIAVNERGYISKRAFNKLAIGLNTIGRFSPVSHVERTNYYFLGIRKANEIPWPKARFGPNLFRKKIPGIINATIPWAYFLPRARS